MADMTREEAIKVLEQDYKAVENSNMPKVARAYDVAISDMKRVEELEIEVKALKKDNSYELWKESYEEEVKRNERLKDRIAKAKAKVERKCIGKQFSEAVIYGMQKAVGIFDEYLGE